jgi:hypothetical protein
MQKHMVYMFTVMKTVHAYELYRHVLIEYLTWLQSIHSLVFRTLYERLCISKNKNTNVSNLYWRARRKTSLAFCMFALHASSRWCISPRFSSIPSGIQCVCLIMDQFGDSIFCQDCLSTHQSNDITLAVILVALLRLYYVPRQVDQHI